MTQRLLLKILMGSLFVSTAMSVCAQSQPPRKAKMVCVSFYNLENLFDTEDDPLTQDEEFTPSGAKAWNKAKYEDKLSRLSKVISGFGLDYKINGADMLGVCEVENRRVLEDLIRQPELLPMNYEIIHHESFDPRGIDLALIYKPGVFHPSFSAMYPITLTDRSGNTKYTRGILMVLGKMGNQPLCVFVNHWPSRRGGEEATRPFRIEAAKTNKRLADSISLAHPNTAFIIMGDLNDNPNNESVEEVLPSSGSISKVKEKCFFNPFYKNFNDGEGTLAHNNTWNLFDQIILSHHFINRDQDQYTYHKNKVYRMDFMMEKHGHFKDHPKRTFAGDVYNYGYSDHFPVLVYLVRQVQ